MDTHKSSDILIPVHMTHEKLLNCDGTPVAERLKFTLNSIKMTSVLDLVDKHFLSASAKPV